MTVVHHHFLFHSNQLRVLELPGVVGGGVGGEKCVTAHCWNVILCNSFQGPVATAGKSDFFKSDQCVSLVVCSLWTSCMSYWGNNIRASDYAGFQCRSMKIADPSSRPPNNQVPQPEQTDSSREDALQLLWCTSIALDVIVVFVWRAMLWKLIWVSTLSKINLHAA